MIENILFLLLAKKKKIYIFSPFIMYKIILPLDGGAERGLGARAAQCFQIILQLTGNTGCSQMKRNGRPVRKYFEYLAGPNEIKINLSPIFVG